MVGNGVLHSLLSTPMTWLAMGLFELEQYKQKKYPFTEKTFKQFKYKG